MYSKRVLLCKEISDATLDFYPAKKPACGDSLLIIPGGGYAFVSYDREGKAIADAFCEKGVSCFVLTYSIGDKAAYPTPLLEAAFAMKHIKENAEEYEIDRDRVFAVGFSAGGHLCGMLGTLFDRPEVTDAVKCDSDTIRPHGLILCYAVLKNIDQNRHSTYRIISGGNERTAEFLDITAHFSEKTPPVFFMHTAEDGLVNAENTIYAMQACKRAGVSFEAHIYPFGPHGIALANEKTCEPGTAGIQPEAAKWVDQAAVWMRQM